MPMLPIGPLMIEHRLIERMIRLMADELRQMEETARTDPAFIDTAVDFIRTYADRCHHGKEEDILFRDLAMKPLSPEHRKTMEELVAEHVYARGRVKALVEAKEQYVQAKSQALEAIRSLLADLVAFYPAHIAKEDKHFFIRCMSYFTKQEQERMLQEFWDFDRQMIHWKYKTLVERLETK
jgi:hemerythrin-like domain-containing protein